MSERDVLRALNAHLDALTFTPTLKKYWGGDQTGRALSEYLVWPFYEDTGNISISTSPVQTRASRTYGVRCFVPERKGYDELMRLRDAVTNHFYPDDGTLNDLTAGSVRIQINSRPDWRDGEPRGGAISGAVLVRCFFLIT